MGPAHAQPTRLRRPGRRYPSDLDDEEWAVLEPLLPPLRAGGRGRPPVHSRRSVVNAILYLDRAGCAWRYLPKDFPPWRTVYGYFAAWRDDGTLQQVHDQLREAARTAAGRNTTPTAAVIDSQSVRAADTVPKATRGWDQAKKVNGRKRRHRPEDDPGNRAGGPMTCTPSRSCPAAGSSKEPSPGSPRNAAASATTNACPPATKPWCCGPWSPS